MTEFWARFQLVGEDIFRYDTRIYLYPVTKISPNDVCIGAVVGKNPGSAKATDPSNPEIQPVRLDKDQMLRTVRNVVQRAYAKAGVEVSPGQYIQVLNLFYLCDADLTQAVKSVKRHNGRTVCQMEANSFPWLWYIWGNECRQLSAFKERFENLSALQHFYFDKNTDLVVNKAPSQSSFAKHPQGLTQESVISHISGLI